MKDRHIRLRTPSGEPQSRRPSGETQSHPPPGWPYHGSGCSPHALRGLGLGQPLVLDLHIESGTLVDVAYKIRNNDHPEYGGIEIELAGIRKSTAQ